MKNTKSWLAMLAIAAALASAHTGNAQCRYTITDLGTLPGLDYSFVWGNVNAGGHVAGYATNSPDPYDFTDGVSSFLWTGPGEMQLLPSLPGATSTLAYAINDLDQVCGVSGPTPEGYLAAVWEEGTVKALAHLPGHNYSDAFGINNSGLVVGRSIDFSVDPWTSAAGYWYKGKAFRLPPLDGASNSAAVAVSEWGQIVGDSGTRAVLWSMFPKASVIDLGTLGGDGSYASDINECGQIVGQAQNVMGEWLPVLWDGLDIIELPIPEQDRTGGAYWINNRGQAVGFSGSDPDQGDLHGMRALLWEDGGVINLQDQIPANSGWKLRQAAGINDQGQISGFGQRNGKMRAFLLTPTIVPKANVTGSTGPNAFTVAAAAARKPPPSESLLWPTGARLMVDYYPQQSSGLLLPPRLRIVWPIDTRADHYRVTVLKKVGSEYVKVMDSSPATYTTYYGLATAWWICNSASGISEITGMYEIRVTAYSGPVDATAHSESLIATQTVPGSARKH